MIEASQVPSLIGVGLYSASEAARLVRTSPRNIRRWLGGYSFVDGDRRHDMPPLWRPQIPRADEAFEIGFRDLIELRFVEAFIKAGVGLKAIRNCLELARECVGSAHPFSTQRFRTDGRTIFLESIEQARDPQLLDLKARQYVIRQIIERSFKDLDIDAGSVVRWRPFRGKRTIVIDPERAFGRPIAAEAGVPTEVLDDAVAAEGSIGKVARQFELSEGAVRDAVAFQRQLRAA